MRKRNRLQLREAALYPGKRWWYDSDAVVVVAVTKRSVSFAFDSGSTATFSEKAKVIAGPDSLRPFTLKEDQAMRRLQKQLYREWYQKVVPF